MAFKGLIARGLNYLYHKGKHNPEYDQAKYNELTKKAQEAKSKGNLYASMIFWAEADYLSGHSRFDEVLREITPMNQKVGQEGGCSVEGQAIEESLYAKLPITGLPGPCRIQAFQVNSFGKENKEALISAARQQYKIDRAEAYQDSPSEDDEFAVAAPAFMGAQYTLVADLNLPGKNKSYSSDVDIKKEENSITQNIIDPIAKAFKEQFASKIQAATSKINSKDLLAKVDGFIINALYGADLEKQNEYESLHEQQFGRKLSTTGAMSSAFAY